MKMATSRRTPNGMPLNLTIRQQFQLAEAVRQRADRLREWRPTLTEAAEEFGRWLGFSISTSSIRTAMKAAGVTWDASGRRREEPNRIKLDVGYSCWDEGRVTLQFRPERRPDDRRLCGVTVPRDVPPAESAAWLRRVADVLERHGAGLQAFTGYESDDMALVDNDRKTHLAVEAAWEATLSAGATDPSR